MMEVELKCTKKVSAIAALSSRIKIEKSATSKARSSQPAISSAVRRQYERDLLKAFDAMKEGMSVHEASRQYGFPESSLGLWSKQPQSIDCRKPQQSSKHIVASTTRCKHEAVQDEQKRKSRNKTSTCKQDGDAETTHHDKTRGNAAINHRKPCPSSKPTASLTARRKQDQTSLKNAAQATTKRKSGNKASSCKQDGDAETTHHYKTRGNTTINRRKPCPSSKPAASLTARRKQDQTSLKNAAQATTKRKSGNKASSCKQDGDAETTHHYKTRGNTTINRRKPCPSSKPAASLTARRKQDQTSLKNAAQATTKRKSGNKASSCKQDGDAETTHHYKTRGNTAINWRKPCPSSKPAASLTARRKHDQTSLKNAAQATTKRKSGNKASSCKQDGDAETTHHYKTRGNTAINWRKPCPSSKPATSLTARRKHDQTSLKNAVQATTKRKSDNKASSCKQDGDAETTHHYKTRGNTAMNRRKPCPSSKPVASLTARRKHDQTSLKNAVQATTKRKSGNKASSCKQDGDAETTHHYKTRGNTAMNRRKPCPSSKPVASSKVRRKQDQTSLKSAVQATIKRKSGNKAPKQDGVPESTSLDKARGNDAINRRKSHQSSNPTASLTSREKYSSVSLVIAVTAIKDGMSISKAARVYGVPKSTLYSRTKRNVSTDCSRHKRNTPTALRIARRQWDEVKAIQKGMAVHKAYRQLGVPDTALSDKSGGIVKIDSTKLYNKNNLILACQAFQTAQGGMSINKAATTHGVPPSTLRDMIRRKNAIEGPGRSNGNRFTRDQEQKLVDHIKHMASIGYEYSKSNIRFLAGDYANACGKNIPANEPLANNWYSDFVKRWPNLELVLKPKKESKANYFKQLAKILISNNLLESPECIYNIDGYDLCEERKLCTPPKSVSNATSRQQAVKSQAIRIIAGGNASGYYIPPYFVFPGKSWNQLLVEGSLPGTAGAMNGWSNSIVLKNYLLKHFAKHAYLRDTKYKGYKTLVLYDGNKYHLSLFMADWAMKNHVILFVLPPDGSHVTRAQDAGLLGPFMSMFASECKLHVTNKLITKYDIAKLAVKPYLKAMSPSNLKAVFRKAGVYPFATDFKGTPSTISPSSSDDQDKENSTMQPSQTADNEVIPDETVARASTTISKQAPALLKTKKKRFTNFSDANPTNKKTCRGIPLGDGSDDYGGIETQLLKSTTISSPLPDPLGCASVSTTVSISSEEKSKETNCCVCGRFSPPAIKNFSSLTQAKWAQCCKCGHLTHLFFCTNTSVVWHDRPFLCPHCM